MIWHSIGEADLLHIPIGRMNVAQGLYVFWLGAGWLSKIMSGQRAAKITH